MNPVLTKLFNKLLDFEDFPESWGQVFYVQV